MHDKVKKYSCSHCVYRSFFRPSIIIHIKRHHGNTDARLLINGCVQCEAGIDHTVCANQKNRSSRKEGKWTQGEVIGNNITSQNQEKANYSCSECEYTSTKKMYVFNHEKITHVNDKILNKEIIKCNQCEYETLVRQSLKIHTQSVHDNVKKYFCSLCVYGTFFRQSIINHIKRHHGNNDARLLITGKEQKLTQEENITYQNHENYSCPECEYTSTKKMYVTNHKKITHVNDKIQNKKIIKCNQCEFETLKQSCYIAHTQAVHDKVKKYSCSHCIYRTFIRLSGYKHIKCHHGNTDARLLIIGCVQCEAGIDHTVCAEVITKRNSDRDVFNCDECNYICSAKQSLRIHAKTKHDKKDDIKTNHDNKDEIKIKGFDCTFCPLVSGVTRKEILKHVKTDHPDKKLFHCDSCDYKCNWKPNLKVHKAANIMDNC